MTRYTVVAVPEAEQELLQLYVNGPPSERNRIRRASDFFDKQLRFDAHLKGFPVPDRQGARFWFKDILEIDFEVREPDRMVKILKYRRSAAVK